MRNKRVLELLRITPMTASMLVWLKVFPSLKVARRRLRRLFEQQKIKRGFVQLKETGRPEYLYSTKTIKADWAEHNAELSFFLLPFIDIVEVLTGGDVDPELLPDATLRGQFHDAKGQRERTIYVERDRETESYKQVVDRWEKAYVGKDDLVLWVCDSESRKKGLLARAERVANVLLVATYQDATERTWEPVWWTYGGMAKRIPIPVAQSGE